LASSAAIRQYSTSSSTRQLVAARLDQIADRVHLGGALERRQRRPAVGRRARRVDRAPRVAAVPLRDHCDLLAGRRARRRRRLPARGRRPLAGDEQLAGAACGGVNHVHSGRVALVDSM
jgi:hypothetical protein